MVLAISILCRAKRCLVSPLMTTSPKIVTANKMANNVWEVNERCSVFHIPFAKIITSDKKASAFPLFERTKLASEKLIN